MRWLDRVHRLCPAALRPTRPSATRYPELRKCDLYLSGGGVPPPEFRPRKDRPSWRMALPLDWAANPFNDTNWQFHLNSWRMIDPLVHQWYRRSDASLVREGFAYAQDWWRYHRDGRSTAVSWNDMASGIRAFKLAFFLERLRLGDLDLSRAGRTDLFALVDAHATFIANPKNVRTNNHSLIQAIGYRLLCRQAYDRKACADGEARSASYLRRIIDHQFTSEGIHREHSPGYHFFVTDLLADLNVAELFTDVADVATITQRAEAIRPWLVFPNREVVRVGDHAPMGDPLTEASQTHVVAGRGVSSSV